MTARSELSTRSARRSFAPIIPESTLYPQMISALIRVYVPKSAIIVHTCYRLRDEISFFLFRSADSAGWVRTWLDTSQGALMHVTPVLSSRTDLPQLRRIHP